MKEEFNRYGARLSEDEYMKKIVALYENASPLPGRKEETRLRQAALNLSIDHKLGTAFPPEKREAMWQVAQGIEKDRWRLPFLSLKDAFHAIFIKKDLAPTEKHLGAMARYLTGKYGAVLDEAELEQFLRIKQDGITPAP